MSVDTRPHRPRRPAAAPSHRRLTGAALTALAALAAVTGCAGPTRSPDPTGTPAPAIAQNAPAPTAAGGPEHPRYQTSPALPQRLPGLGDRTVRRIPDDARQVLVVTGTDRNASSATAVLHTRTAEGWQAGPTWPARNARDGWTTHHRADDLRTPIGVFTLTDAGGRRPDPGTDLPYDHSDAFTATGTGFNGESLAGSFDYVIAIDYNREPGTSPLDWTRPLGADRGGGIWLHVDHDGPTHGCIALSETHMKQLLRRLDPAKHPVIVMGDAASLAR